MSHWRRRPIIVEAWQFHAGRTARGIARMDRPHWFCEDIATGTDRTLEHHPRPHMRIRGVTGDGYPCRVDVFAATYEPLP